MNDYRQHPSVVAHWLEGSLQPFPEARAAAETVWFALPPDPDTDQIWEGLRGRSEEDGTFTVLAVPAFIYDVNYGDRVKVMRSAEESFVATGVEHDAGNFTFRVLLKTDDDENAWRPLVTELAQMGCLLDVMSPRFFAVSCGEDLSQEVADTLFGLQSNGVLHCETGRTHAPQQGPA